MVLPKNIYFCFWQNHTHSEPLLHLTITSEKVIKLGQSHGSATLWLSWLTSVMGRCLHGHNSRSSCDPCLTSFEYISFKMESRDCVLSFKIWNQNLINKYFDRDEVSFLLPNVLDFNSQNLVKVRESPLKQENSTFSLILDVYWKRSPFSTCMHQGTTSVMVNWNLINFRMI